jgi:outer membrane protein TolC
MSWTDSIRVLVIGAFCASAATAQNAAEVRHLTLSEAVRLAVGQNRELKIARFKVVENEQKKSEARSNYFPQIRNESNLLHITDLQNIEIPAGAFGVIPDGTLVPNRNLLLDQGKRTLITSGTGVAQPITQLIRIHQANKIAAAQVASSKDDVKKAENEVALRVHELYYGILVTRLQKRAADQETAFAQIRLRESEDDVQNGSALKVSTIEGRAGLLQSEQSAITAELQLSDLTVEMNDLLGLPLDTRLELSPVQPAALEDRPREEYERIAWSENPQILAAAQAVEQAKSGISAAKSAYIPDVSALARYSYQNGVPFLVHNFGTFGLNLTYDVFDFGKRRAVVREREAQLAQAQENLTRLKESVSVRIERSYNKVERTKHMLQVAAEVVKLRTESERLAENQLAEGVVLVSARRQASAASYKAQADLLQAQLAYLLAGAELEEAAGHTPGL